MRKLTIPLTLTLCSFSSLGDTYYSLGSDKEVLGAGFEQSLRMPLDRCLDGEWVYQGGSEGGLTYQGAFDSDTLINTMTGSIKGGVNLILFGGSVKYSIRKKSTENNNTMGSTLVFNYNKGSYNFENRSVKPAVASLLQSNPSAARSQCGDGFIHNVKLGSNLYVTAKIHFRNKSEYEWAQTKIKIKVLFWSKTKTITKEFYEATQNAVYSIGVSSDSPMPPQMAQLSGTKYCRTDNMDACISHANAVFSYLFENGSYGDELTDQYLNTTTYDVASYEESGHYSLAYAGTANNAQRYIELSQRLRVYQDFVDDEIENLQAFLAVSDDETEQTQLTARLDERHQQKAALQASADYCFTLPGTGLCEVNMEAAIDTVN